MSFKNKAFIIFAILLCLDFNLPNIAAAAETAEALNYPDFGYEYLGKDKFEGFNRKMFAFNQGLNKYAIRPIHIVWASVMPQYGMDRIKNATKNIE